MIPLEKAFHKTLDLQFFGNEQIFAEKIIKTARQVKKNVLKTLLSSTQVTIQESLKHHVAASKLDEKTNQFFHWILGEINSALDDIPGLTYSFMILSVSTQDYLIRKKFVEKIALPSINALLLDLKRLENGSLNLCLLFR